MDEKEIIARKIAAAIERETYRMFDGMTSTTAVPAEPLTLAKIEQAWAECQKVERNLRPNDVTIQVDLSHTGPMLETRHPTEGITIECSWRQAQEIHGHWPLVLKEIVAVDRALFRPAHQFDRFVLKTLPMPPYELPPAPPADA